MSQSDDHHVLHPTGITIPLEIRLYVMQLLHQTLACTVDLRSHVRQACWRDDITLAADVEDAGSAAVYTDMSRGVDKQLWVLEAHLHRQGHAPHRPQATDGRDGTRAEEPCVFRNGETRVTLPG